MQFIIFSNEASIVTLICINMSVRSNVRSVAVSSPAAINSTACVESRIFQTLCRVYEIGKQSLYQWQWLNTKWLPITKLVKAPTEATEFLFGIWCRTCRCCTHLCSWKMQTKKYGLPFSNYTQDVYWMTWINDNEVISQIRMTIKSRYSILVWLLNAIQ